MQSRKDEVSKRLKQRKNFNKKLFNKFNDIQLPIDFKKKKSQFIIKNNFTKKTIDNSVKKILKKILK